VPPAKTAGRPSAPSAAPRSTAQLRAAPTARLRRRVAPPPLPASDTVPLSRPATRQVTPLPGGFPRDPQVHCLPPPAHLLTRCSPATFGDSSTPPLPRTSPSIVTRRRAVPAPPPAAPLLEGGAVTISLTASTWGSSSPAHSCSPPRTWGHHPSPTVHSQPWALSQPLIPCKGTTKAARRAKGTTGVYSVTHPASPGSRSALGLRAPDDPPAPPTPQQSFKKPRLLFQRRTVGQSAPGATRCWAEAAKNEKQDAGHYKRGEK